MRVAVVGHVEWIQFVRVDHVPSAGEIVHPTEAWEEPGGGGAVAAVQLAKLAGGATFFTALGDDDLGRRARRELRGLGVRVEAVFRTGVPQRRGFTFIDRNGERTITTVGARLGPGEEDGLPWGELAATDAVYFTAGDAGALRAARRARILVVTAREVDNLRASGLRVDALVGSARDPSERYVPGSLDPPPRLVVRTKGSDGGTFETSDGHTRDFPAAPVPGPISDAYGCGDSFAAGLTWALGSGRPPEDAVAFAARCGAACLTGRGPYEGQLALRTLSGAQGP
jgi:ribokinase